VKNATKLAALQIPEQTSNNLSTVDSRCTVRGMTQKTAADKQRKPAFDNISWRQALSSAGKTITSA